MALICAETERRCHGPLPATTLMAEGRTWGYRHNLGRLNDDLALQVGYALVFGGTVNLQDVFDTLGVSHTLETKADGSTYPVRVTEPAEPEERPAPALPDGSEKMKQIKPGRRVKIDTRVSVAEREALETEARRRGVPTSTLLRELVFGALSHRKWSAEEDDALRKRWGGLPRTLRGS